MRQKVFAIFITTLMTLSLSSCIAVKVSDSNVESSQTEITSGSTENNSFDTTSDSSELPTIEEIVDANNISKLIEKYGSLKIDFEDSYYDSPFYISEVIFKDSGEFITYNTLESGELDLHRGYVYYKGNTINREQGRFQLNMYSSKNITNPAVNFQDSSNSLDDYLLSIEDGYEYSVIDIGDKYMLYARNAADDMYFDMFIMKEDLSIYEKSIHISDKTSEDKDPYYISKMTIEYGCEVNYPEFLNELNGQLKTVTYIYNYGQSDEHIDKFEIPVTWEACCIYDNPVTCYSDPECTIPFEYPGDNLDYTVYTKIAEAE